MVGRIPDGWNNEVPFVTRRIDGVVRIQKVDGGRDDQTTQDDLEILVFIQYFKLFL